jgi:hypothetical protein
MGSARLAGLVMDQENRMTQIVNASSVHWSPATDRWQSKLDELAQLALAPGGDAQHSCYP